LIFWVECSVGGYLALAKTIGRFYDRGVPKRKGLGWYSLVFEGILTLTIDF
jgi:hypothetical protein